MHKEQLRLQSEQNIVQKALKKQLTTAFDPKYLEELHNECTGFNNTSIQDIFTYLYVSYGNLDEADIEYLNAQLAELYDPTEPFGTFVKRIKDIMELAEAARYGYTPAQITAKAFNFIKKSQAYPKGVREWKCHPEAEKTWANLKQYFALKAKEYRKKHSSNTSLSYQVANTTNQALLEVQADF